MEKIIAQCQFCFILHDLAIECDAMKDHRRSSLSAFEERFGGRKATEIITDILEGKLIPFDLPDIIPLDN